MSVETKTAAELAVMAEAGRLLAEVHAELAKAVAPGVTTAELDAVAAAGIKARKAKAAFIGYRGFPATLCVSVNAEVVHGIPSKTRVLAEGDIVGLDLGLIWKGFYADSAVTHPVGKVSPAARKLIAATSAALEAGLAEAVAGRRIGDIGEAVQTVAEKAGYSVVREFVGHGIGRALHEDPPVPNYGKAGTGLRLAPGMVLAIEPMVNAGGPDVRVLSDGWTAVTSDGALSAHFEHTVAVTEDGPRVLTRLG
ncbi:MAG: type I methionyl aminopeptidase [Elusimicrobia bacterium]|nr:type I methionyl aminopeptidase [Elusimicrobiota bacterium]